MPRNVKGIGRTGKKHKKPADGGSPVMPNEKGITGPLFTPLQDTTNEPDGQAEEASSSAEHCALADAVDKLRPFDPEAYVSCPHPGYSSGEPFLPGFRGHSGAKGARSGGILTARHASRPMSDQTKCLAVSRQPRPTRRAPGWSAICSG